MAIINQNAVDPLEFIYFLMLGGTVKNKLSFLTGNAVALLSMHFFNFIGALEVILWKNTEHIWARIQMFIISCPISVVLIIILAYYKHLCAVKDITEGKFVSIKSRGIAFQMRVEKETKFCTFLCSSYLILTICSIFTLFYWDKQIRSSILDSIQTIPLAYRWIGLIPLIGILLSFTYLPNVLPIYMTYIGFHLRFQYHILIDYLKENIKAIDVNNENEQKECRIHLEKCVDHIVTIQNGFRQLSVVANISLLAITIAGLPTFVIEIYICLKQGISLNNNTFTLCVIVRCAVCFIHLCVIGQMIIDETAKFYDFMCTIPWIYFNKSNRMALLMILVNMQKPMKISAYGLIDMDNAFIVKITKLSYTLLAFLPKLQIPELW